MFKSKAKNPNYDDIFDIDPDDLWSQKANVQIIDVRQPDEFTDELGHIEGASLLVLDTLPEKFKSLPKDKTYVFVCRSGGRSSKATAFMHDQGYSSIYNMRGGMLLWNKMGLPTTK